MAADPTREKQHRTVMYMAAAMFVGAPLAYLFVVYSITSTQPVTPHPNWLLMYLLLAVGAIQVVLIMPFITATMVKGARTPGRSRSSVATVQTVMIVRMTLIESIFVYGLLYFFLTDDTTALVYFYALGALAVILGWPTRDRFDQIADTLEGK